MIEVQHHGSDDASLHTEADQFAYFWQL